jgi:MFS transporter, ACS family, solute carrier family 17 (sodium-dependent inorganic phosphate cotransporter), other
VIRLSVNFLDNAHQAYLCLQIFGVGILGTSLMTLLTPVLCYQGIYYLYAVRVIEGILGGLSFPSVNAVYAKWSPPLERSRVSGVGMSGCFAGTVITMLASGWLSVHFGWQSIFYVFGAFGTFWSVLWFIFVKESPENDCKMNTLERNFIVKSLERRGQVNVVKPPWKSIFTSMPVMSIAVAHFSYTWGFYTLLTALPSYMKDILDFDLQQTGFISAIPYLTLSLLLFVSGYLADWFQMKNFLSTTQVRKYFNNLSFFSQMIFLLLAAYFTDTTLIILCITFSVGLGAFSISGYLANPLDIAPQFASIIVGISNTFATLPGLISPVLTGYIVTTPVRLDEIEIEIEIDQSRANALTIVGRS